MVKTFIGLELDPLSPPTNEGDGHRMGMRVGAELGNMTSHWGQPGISEPGFELDGRPVVQMASVRSLPGVIVVNGHGRRFINEGVTYQDFPKVLGTYDPVAVEYPNEGPLWLVFDQRVKDSAVVLPTVLPGQPAPEWITQAPTVRELAQRIDLDPDQLETTVTRWNKHVADGEDADFHRGTTRFESHMSGYLPTPERILAPVEQAPFYAVELRNGTLGTSGGLRIDSDARVRRYGGAVIDGLYAAGNVSACVFGPAYPGGGATIGPALTFGYRAGRHVAGRPRRDL
jgi:succinate dehydrogenase/fumarate reductase flavoprotein subunit